MEIVSCTNVGCFRRMTDEESIQHEIPGHLDPNYTKRVVLMVISFGLALPESVNMIFWKFTLNLQLEVDEL